MAAKDPLAALKAAIAEGKKAGLNKDALDMAAIRAQSASPEMIASMVRDIKEAIANAVLARKQADAAKKQAAAAAKQEEERRLQALVTERGPLGRVIDRAKVAVGTMTHRSVDSSAPQYKQALAEAKEKAKGAIISYRQAAAEHNAALERMDKYVSNAAQSIANTQSTKDIMHFMNAIMTATRTRSVAARSMQTPFSRPGAKAMFSARGITSDGVKAIDLLTHMNPDAKTSSVVAKVLQLLYKMVEDSKRLASNETTRLHSRPGTKAKMAFWVSHLIKTGGVTTQQMTTKVKGGVWKIVIPRKANESVLYWIADGGSEERVASGHFETLMAKALDISYQRWLEGSSRPESSSRPGAKARMAMTVAQAEQIINTIDERKASQTSWSPAMDHLTKQRDFAQRLIVAHRQGDTANIRRYSALLEKAGWARPGAKARMGRRLLEIEVTELEDFLDAYGVKGYDINGPNGVVRVPKHQEGRARDAISALNREIRKDGIGGSVVVDVVAFSRPGAKAKMGIEYSEESRNNIKKDLKGLAELAKAYRNKEAERLALRYLQSVLKPSATAQTWMEAEDAVHHIMDVMHGEYSRPGAKAKIST